MPFSDEDLEKYKEMVNIYTYSTNVGCKAIDIKNMEILASAREKPSFCNLVCSFNKGADDCKNSYRYGALQVEKLGEEYIYFCPYGLVNLAVPIFNKEELTNILVAGPVLLHTVDDLLIEDILKQNPSLVNIYRELREYLDLIPVLDTFRVRCLSKLLMELAKNIMVSKVVNIKHKKEMNEIKSKIAEKIHELKERSTDDNGIYPIKKEKALLERVKRGDRQGAKEILNDLLGFIFFQNASNMKIVRSKAIELTALLARAAIEVGADLEIIFGLEYIYYEQINNIKSLDELAEVLAKILDRFIESTFSIKNVKNKDIIYKAISYIRENYDDKNISLNDVANQVGLSQTYFSKLFKEELDMTYTDYLNKVRIEASKIMLSKGQSLADIANFIGFNDQSYFSKVFKKIEGISPGKWKNE